ncbi:TlpA disulfide reductase family protein [Mesorhizobium sp. LHD-90]|uniref:thiol:disulfide interchange protein TlpA n=1 Tax=Mesorhizobium sp. LHD-90 TaxID=3071414 RepID=UPI0027E0EEB2|nr:TlpA disulfide reductase family protein [Mesorhizobium sp. LHD-90]MDQ6432669.1 TlpA disulfide reductase family protein [Mesorhizobium sp. LHD-90]
MSDGKQKKLIPAWRAILTAMAAGALAGAVAVYVTGGFSGNTPAGAPGDVAQEAVATAPAPDPADSCTLKADMAKTVAASATGQVAAMLPADPPQSLAKLAFNAPDGKPMTLADRAGKTVLLNLWATWCAPCRAEMPALDALQKEAGDDGFEVIAVNVDSGDDTKPKKFLAETQISALAYYRDNTLDLFNDLKRRGLALGLPVTLLIDGEGCLLAHMNGPAEWAGEDAKKLIAAARGS